MPVTSVTSTPPVRLVSIRAGSYCAFSGNLESSEGSPGLAIRPLTLILGRNSSGKSALIRLIRLALRAIAQPTTDSRDTDKGEAPGSRHLPLSVGDVVLASRFNDMVYGRLPKEVSLGLDLDVVGGTCGYDVTLQPADSVGDRSWLVRFTGHDPDAVNVDVELDLDETLRAQRAIYRGVDQPTFDGLAPEGLLPTLRRAARTLDGAVSHVGPLRKHIGHVMPRGARPSVGYDGSGAPDLLASDDDLASRVDEWFREHFEGCRLQVRPLVDAFELTTTTPDGTAINLAQAGEGLHQVLPIVVQQKLHEQRDPSSLILDLVEQPELHLHDAVHAPLADLFMETARLGRGSVVIETHSQGLLLRVRRRVAERTFDPADLAVYFVDRAPGGSFVRAIQVNQDGELSEWPEGVFLESYREVLAIQRAIRSR